jgi:hypothetical protein
MPNAWLIVLASIFDIRKLSSMINNVRIRAGLSGFCRWGATFTPLIAKGFNLIGPILTSLILFSPFIIAKIEYLALQHIYIVNIP